MQIASLLNTVAIQSTKQKKLEDELENHDKRITKVEADLIPRKYKNHTKLGGYFSLSYLSTYLHLKTSKP